MNKISKHALGYKHTHIGISCNINRYLTKKKLNKNKNIY